MIVLAQVNFIVECSERVTTKPQGYTDNCLVSQFCTPYLMCVGSLLSPHKNKLHRAPETEMVIIADHLTVQALNTSRRALVQVPIDETK